MVRFQTKYGGTPPQPYGHESEESPTDLWGARFGGLVSRFKILHRGRYIGASHDQISIKVSMIGNIATFLNLSYKLRHPRGYNYQPTW